MSAHLTVKERETGKVARMEAAVAELKPRLAAYAREHGGRFILFGSAARREMRPDSDVDIFVDFPDGAHSGAIRFANDACWSLGLKPDILGFCGLGGRIGDRIGKEGLALPGDEEKWSDPMTDEDRWGDILDSARGAAKHFRAAEEMFDEGGLENPEAYRARMAFYHAMQSGHTAVESALKRTLVAMGQRLPTGPEWHKELVKLAVQPLGPRGQPILDAELAAAVGETLRFRHFASYGFDAPFFDYKARPAVEAGRMIANRLEAALAAFAQRGNQT